MFREYESEHVKELPKAEIEKRVKLLLSIMENEKILSRKGSQISKTKKDPFTVKKDGKGFNKNEIETLFPAQLKSYYASSEL